MKKLALTSAIALTVMGSAASAGSLADAYVEPEVIVEDTSSSAGGWVVPVLLLILLGLALSGGSDNGGNQIITVPT